MKPRMSLPPINAEREALSFALNSMQALEHNLRHRYRAYPAQVEQIVTEYDKIKRNLEARVVEIDQAMWEEAQPQI